MQHPSSTLYYRTFCVLPFLQDFSTFLTPVSFLANFSPVGQRETLEITPVGQIYISKKHIEGQVIEAKSQEKEKTQPFKVFLCF